jgi:hypothetical protein
MKLAFLLLLTSLAAAQCEKASWVVDDDGIHGVVSNEGKPLKHAHARVQLTKGGWFLHSWQVSADSDST